MYLCNHYFSFSQITNHKDVGGYIAIAILYAIITNGQLGIASYFFCIEEKAHVSLSSLLRYITGSSSIPPLQTSSLIRITYQLDDNIFPKAQACFSKLILPVVHKNKESFNVSSHYFNLVTCSTDILFSPFPGLFSSLFHLLVTSIGDKASQIQAVYDQISVHVRGLKALGARYKQYSRFLIPVIMSKLPPEIRLQIARVTSQEVWNIEELLKLIKGERDKG